MLHHWDPFSSSCWWHDSLPDHFPPSGKTPGNCRPNTILTVFFAWFSEMLIQPPLWGWRASGKHVVKDKDLCAVSLLADTRGEACVHLPSPGEGTRVWGRKIFSESWLSYLLALWPQASGFPDLSWRWCSPVAGTSSGTWNDEGQISIEHHNIGPKPKKGLNINGSYRKQQTNLWL